MSRTRYSKAILGWHLSLSNSAGNVKAALQKAIATIHICHPSHSCSVLVADGGGENHALCIDELLKQTPRPKMTKVIAQKDIAFSNSPIEAINRTVKRYLRHFMPKSETALKKVLELVEQDYNHIRPHISLNGLTPFEAYTGQTLAPLLKNDLEKARQCRVEAIRKMNCAKCR